MVVMILIQTCPQADHRSQFGSQKEVLSIHPFVKMVKYERVAKESENILSLSLIRPSLSQLLN